MKEYKKLIIGFIIGGIIASSITVYAYSYLASEVSYTRNNTTTSVSNALDDLYSKIPQGTIPITTKGSQIDVSNYQYVDTTGLYTADETKSASGTIITTAGGSDSISIGFEPKRIIAYIAEEYILIYDKDYSTKTCQIFFNDGTLIKRDVGATDEGIRLDVVGSETKIHTTGSRTIKWFATK